MALSWWYQLAKHLTSKDGPRSRKESRRLRENLYRRSGCERLEDRCLLTANLFLQGGAPTGPLPYVPTGTSAASDTLAVGGVLPVEFATPAGSLPSGFAAGTFYFAYDATVFNSPAAIAYPSPAYTNELTPAQAAELNINNGVLRQSTGPTGFAVTVTDTTQATWGNYHVVTIIVTDNTNLANNVTVPTGGVLFAINLVPKATTTSTNLNLVNSSPIPNYEDMIYSANASGAYALSLPQNLKTAFNSTYDFQANVVANPLPTLCLGGQMNTWNGAITPIPSVAAGGTAMVYANIQNADPSGSGLYAWTAGP